MYKIKTKKLSPGLLTPSITVQPVLDHSQLVHNFDLTVVSMIHKWFQATSNKSGTTACVVFFLYYKAFDLRAFLLVNFANWRFPVPIQDMFYWLMDFLNIIGSRGLNSANNVLLS